MIKLFKLKKLRKNKKASVLDNFYVMIQFFGFALFLLVMYVVWAAFTNADMETNLWGKTTTGTAIKNNAQVAFNNWDWIAVLAYFGLHLGIIVMAFLLKTHPIIYVAGFLLIVVLVMIAVPLSNAWEEIAADDEFSSAVTNIPKVDYIMDKLPTFEMIWAFVTLIVLAGLSKSEGAW